MQRLQNTLLYLFLSTTPDPIVPRNIIASYAPETPYINNEQLEARTTLYLLEYDDLFDHHLPTYPNMKFVGGLVFDLILCVHSTIFQLCGTGLPGLNQY